MRTRALAVPAVILALSLAIPLLPATADPRHDRQAQNQTMGQGQMPMMGQGMMPMMGQGMMMQSSGMRVTPILHLAPEDVRHFFEHWIQRIGNKRLRVGNVAETDDVITADIETLDGSLVQQFVVDRHTGLVDTAQ